MSNSTKAPTSSPACHKRMASLVSSSPRLDRIIGNAPSSLSARVKCVRDCRSCGLLSVCASSSSVCCPSGNKFMSSNLWSLASPAKASLVTTRWSPGAATVRED
ncbi:hypothetical protein BASA81_000746 [Batrachochytrium salamandrivorans]|nr:hypothetical protein BASA81_000746 [Batrachochytrium salamandrivorans]